MSQLFPQNPAVLEAAEKLFRSRGYHAVFLADIATEAQIALPALQAHYHDKEDVLNALLEKYSPREDLRSALRQLRNDTPEDLVRDAVRRLLEVFNNHVDFIDLALLDLQFNEGEYITRLFTERASESAGFVNRLSNMQGTRPISSIMLGRAFASMLIGFVATQHIAPRSAQFAMRMFPAQAWVDGITNILLYGILESE